MSGQISDVEAYEADEGRVRVTDDADDNATPGHFAPPGDDSPPLAGDEVVRVEVDEATGATAAVGYAGVDRVAAAGEKRFVARDGSGNVCVVWLKGDGTLSLQEPGGEAEQSYVRGEDMMTYLDGVIAAIGAGLDGVPAAGPGLKAAFEAAVDLLDPLKTAALSTKIKGE